YRNSAVDGYAMRTADYGDRSAHNASSAHGHRGDHSDHGDNNASSAHGDNNASSAHGARSAHGDNNASSARGDRGHRGDPSDGHRGDPSDGHSAVFAVVASVTAGHFPPALAEKGTLPHRGCVRITTGAMVPPDCDSIVMLEDVTPVASPGTTGNETTPHAVEANDWFVTATEVSIPPGIRAGSNVRSPDDDLAENAIIGHAGTVLSSPMLGVLAGQGMRMVEVVRKLRVGIRSSGDEILPAFAARSHCGDRSARSGGDNSGYGGTKTAMPTKPATPRQAGTLYDSNTPLLCAALRACQYLEIVTGDGTRAVDRGFDPPLGDTAQEVEGFFTEALASTCDVVVTTGGMSLGSEDHMRPVFQQLGGWLCHWNLAIKPGRPVGIGRLVREDESTLWWVGLPGNPVAVHVGMLTVLLPLLSRLGGRIPIWRPRGFPLPLGFAVRKKSGRLEFVRVRWHAGQLVPHGKRGAGVLSSLLLAGVADDARDDLVGYAVLPAERTTMAIGEAVLFIPFSSSF
ncbi:MAG: molybdopterin molybdotransferase MoeA, partial [Alphaproteobacteria bacterium]|nr:molybdopterin molybdotransferase MoeA [Alphaproteobacteria bacterium]